MSPSPTSSFIVKIAGACNINCTYCYMYNMGDTTFRSRPKVMSEEVASAALHRIFEYSTRAGLQIAAIVIHGGEPLLSGKRWVAWFIDEARRLTPPGLHLEIGLQTNGILLDREWIDLLAARGIHLGVSLDGPAPVNDKRRLTFSGAGTYHQVRRAIDLLVAAGDAAPPWGVLTVADPGSSSVEIYRHFVEIGVDWMDFLWPDHHHDLPPPWPSGALGRYYTELFDAWYGAADRKITIRWFEDVMRAVLGGSSQLDAIGPKPLTELVIESDGSLEPLDVLRTCGDGMTRLGLDVLHHSVEDLRGTGLFRMGLENQNHLSDECRACPALSICGGGYLPHRWKGATGFRNPSVHSADLLAVITHISTRLRADVEAARARTPRAPGGASSLVFP